jgi:predicted unusual protein kinase regulating ubiquinone biosynthesis (AarF/ABC1/UbiB family)
VPLLKLILRPSQHRDLHWGNILLKSVDQTPPAPESSQLNITPSRDTIRSKRRITMLASASSGIQVTLIDFTLSRATLRDDRIAFDSFADDCIFEGEGASTAVLRL